jgi:predicted Zn-dependent peptidase
VEFSSTVQLLNGPGGESGRAGLLQRYNHYLGDPGYLERDYQRLASVTKADVARAVRTHLAPRRGLSVITEPKAKP